MGFFDMFSGGSGGGSIDSAIQSYTGGGQAFLNGKAFSHMIARSEGTWGKGNNGYNISYGDVQFNNYSRHPNIGTSIGGGKRTTAAGQAQITYSTYQGLVKQGMSPSFDPANQIRMEFQLIKNHGALEDVKAGRFNSAVHKLGSTWDSFHRHGSNELRSIYASAGGSLNGGAEPAYQTVAAHEGRRHRHGGHSLRVENAGWTGHHTHGGGHEYGHGHGHYKVAYHHKGKDFGHHGISSGHNHKEGGANHVRVPHHHHHNNP